MMCKVLFLNTIWADVLLMLGLLLLLNTISGALQLNSGPVFADPSLRDELALAEARRSIMAVITDGEMVLKDDKIMQAGQRTCHYLEGLLGKNEVQMGGLLLQDRDLLHPMEVRHVPSICPSLNDKSSPASSFHVRLRDDRQAQLYTCAFQATGDSDMRWLACIRDDESEVTRAALGSSPNPGQAESISDLGDSRPPSEPSASGTVTLASQRQELALPELELWRSIEQRDGMPQGPNPDNESIGFTLDIYAEELTMLQVKLNFNISDLAHIDTGRFPTMKRWLVQKSVDGFREWLIDQVQADLAGAPTVAFPGSFELHCPGSNGGTLRASDVAVTKMHATSDDLDCFLVHIECKNITQCAPELRRRSKSRRSRQTSQVKVLDTEVFSQREEKSRLWTQLETEIQRLEKDAVAAGEPFLCKGRFMATLTEKKDAMAMDDTPRRWQLDGSEAQMEKVLFKADEDTASEYLKDLISSVGLKDAWGEMAKRFRSVQAQHAQLMSLASRDALNRDFVTRPEFRLTVQEEHYRKLQDHTKRLADLEQKVQEEQAKRLELTEALQEYAERTDQELKTLKPEVTKAHAWLKTLDQRCQEQNAANLKAFEDLQEQLNGREKKLREEATKLSKALEAEVVERKVLGIEVKKQKEFLAGEAFQKHMEDTCNKALANYVHRDVMMSEVQSSTEHMCQPLHVLIHKLEKTVQTLAQELRMKDAYLEQCLENEAAKLCHKDELLNERIDAVVDELPEKATVVSVDDVKGKLLFHVDNLESLHTRLQKEATHKLQEVVTRVSEFQVILQDHEHALQHAAEEILHRGTKYDVAVLTERVDRCAGKDKMEGDLKEIRDTLTWQSTKIESMQFQNGLGGGGGLGIHRSGSRARSIIARSVLGGKLSRSSSMASDLPVTSSWSGKQASTAAPISAEGSTVKFSEEDDDAQDSTLKISIPKVPFAERIDEESLPGDVVSVAAGPEPGGDEVADADDIRNDPMRDLLGLNAGIDAMGLEEHLVDQEQQLQNLQEQLADLMQGSALGASTLTELLQQQLECLAQGVFCLGKICLRPHRGGPATSTVLRHDNTVEVLGHLRSVMHWITHRQRPSEWEPTALATIALQSTHIPDHDVTYSPPRPARVKESQPMPSLRRGKATPREVSPGERRPFASGGPGWRQRGLPANCSYDDVKRPSTTGAIMVASKPMDGRTLVVTPGVCVTSGAGHTDAEAYERPSRDHSVDDVVSLPPLPESNHSDASAVSAKSRESRRRPGM
eukprot:s1681_g5.t1